MCTSLRIRTHTVVDLKLLLNMILFYNIINIYLYIYIYVSIINIVERVYVPRFELISIHCFFFFKGKLIFCSNPVFTY